jgi:hypothetical protein
VNPTRAVLPALLGLAGLAEILCAGATPAAAQDRDRAVSRQDLALVASDLSASYQESSWIQVQMGQALLDTRLLTRNDGAGPLIVYSMTFQARGRVPQADIRRLADETYANLSDVLARTIQIELTGVETLGYPGVGDVAAMRRFGFRVPNVNGEGDGALVTFAREDYVAVLATLSTDGRAVTDVRQYARIVDARVQTEQAGAASSRTSVATPRQRTGAVAPRRAAVRTSTGVEGQS